jgi:membrane protein YqaA with SNARE-associated domain
MEGEPLKSFLYQVFSILVHLGGPGLLGLALLDSSFLFVPLGIDLLVVALTAREAVKLPYYVLMAAAGSVLGCALVDMPARKGGEAGLGRTLPPQRLEYVKRKVGKNATWALTLAALMPPPFPFTAFVAVASALQYPRRKLLTLIAVSRALRFSLVGLIGVFFGNRVIRLAESSMFQFAMLALIVISVAGSAFSIYRLIRRSRGRTLPPEAQPAG